MKRNIIFDLDPVNENSSISLRKFTDKLREHIFALETLKQRPML